MRKKYIPFLLVGVLGLLATQWMLSPDMSDVGERQRSERINLALRQVGHQLLSAIGNDTSMIPPVRQVAYNEFVLRLENEFDYDTLPALVDDAFEMYKINSHYQVAVKSCEVDSLLLGYDMMAFESGEVACMGREQSAECSNITIVFDKNHWTTPRNYWLTTSLLLVGLLLGVRWMMYREEAKKETPVADDTSQPANAGKIFPIGNSVFDVTNQVLNIDNESKSLTFREAKLLHFFVQHPNQVLERENILSNVWGDEGVIVGRSLDVFVSRLRKILKADPSLKIKNVHGVGYRLEVSS